jgi:hypothetical protein
MPEKTKTYVNPALGLTVVDAGGEITVKMDGYPTYELHSKSFPGCRTQKYKKPLLGKYNVVYYKAGDIYLAEIANLLELW